MDTRIRKIFQRIFLTCFIIHVSTNLQSQDFEKEYLTLKNLKMKKNTWLDKYQIYFNSSVIKKKDLSGDVEGLLEIGSYHSGFGICTGLEFDYHFNQIPIFINAYGKLYGLPNEEIFTGWLSLGFGLGIELDNLSSLLKSESGFKE